jgi:simple sugar transport system permease protein
VPFVALFYGYLRQGAQLMNIRTDVPAEVIGVVTAIIILLVSSSFSVNFIKRLFKRAAAPATSAVPAGSAAK